MKTIVVVSSDLTDEIMIKEYFSNSKVVSSDEFNLNSSNFHGENIVFIIDVTEEISPEIEDIMLTSLKNNLSLFLIINNIDKLYELDLSVEEIQNKMLPVYMQANEIVAYSDCIDKENNNFEFMKGNVAFGSVKNNWLINVPMMVETGINLKRVGDYCNKSLQNELSNEIPFNQTLFNMFSL